VQKGIMFHSLAKNEDYDPQCRGSMPRLLLFIHGTVSFFLPAIE
jgi:hypothetical protein